MFNCSHVEGWIEPGISLYTSGTIPHVEVKRTNIKGTQQDHKLLTINTNKKPFSKASICIIFIWAGKVTNEYFKVILNLVLNIKEKVIAPSSVSWKRFLCIHIILLHFYCIVGHARKPERGLKRKGFGYCSFKEWPSERNGTFAVCTEAMLIKWISNYTIFIYIKLAHLLYSSCVKHSTEILLHSSQTKTFIWL